MSESDVEILKIVSENPTFVGRSVDEKRTLSARAKEVNRKIREAVGYTYAQMPAYHFDPKETPDSLNSRGAWAVPAISLINIGVGPSNTRTITDHLAVLRPIGWMMVGHCAGLRYRQMLGDYVLGTEYIRKDGVLDREMPLDRPVSSHPLLNEAVEKAMTARGAYEAKLLGKSKMEASWSRRMRQGVILSTLNRNWEMGPSEGNERTKTAYNVSAVDMESATLAANGVRCRVPTTAFLCISDKPLYGVVKMRSIADDFYREKVAQHFDISLAAVKFATAKEGVKELRSSTKGRMNGDPVWQ